MTAAILRVVVLRKKPASALPTAAMAAPLTNRMSAARFAERARAS